MSDYEDEMLHQMKAQLAVAYAALGVACEGLPLPIALPKGVVNVIDDLIPAVQRVIDIIGDQPVNEDVQAIIFTASIDWLTAADQVITAGINGPNEYRTLCFAASVERVRITLEELIGSKPEDGDDQDG